MDRRPRATPPPSGPSPAAAAADDFARAPMDEQVRRLTALAANAFGAWGLEGAELSLLKYRENAVFRVDGRDAARFVLRVHRPRYRSDDEIRSEVAWMDALAAEGIRTPAAIRTREGDVVAHAHAPGVPEPRQCDLFEFVDGRPLGTLEDGVAGDEAHVTASYRMLGELAARVHEHGVRWKRPAGFVRPAWDTDALVGDDPTFGRFWELECLSDEQREVLFAARDRARAALERFGSAPDRTGLLHGDLLPENVLVSENRPRLIDFDDCGPGWYAFELATGLFPLLTGSQLEWARRGYVTGYRCVRPLPDDHLARLPDMLVARGLSYLGWPAGRPENHDARKLAPFLAAMVTDLARRYLAGEPIAGGA